MEENGSFGDDNRQGKFGYKPRDITTDALVNLKLSSTNFSEKQINLSSYEHLDYEGQAVPGKQQQLIRVDRLHRASTLNSFFLPASFIG